MPKVVEHLVDLRAGLLTALAQRSEFQDVALLEADPRTADELRGPSGDREIAFWVPSDEGEFEETHARGGVSPYHSDGWDMEFRIEVIEDQSGPTRLQVERHVAQLADVVINVVEQDPVLGTTEGQLMVTFAGAERDAIHFPDQQGHAVGITLTMHVDSRAC